MKKFLAFSMALLLILFPLTSCVTDSPDDNSDTDTEENPASPYQGKQVILQKDTATEYLIVYDDTLSSAMVDEVKNFRNRLNFEVNGTGITYSPDYKDMAEAEDGTLEILIGNTNRKESEEAAKLLTKKYEFAIKVFDNGRIAVVATDEEMLKRGMKHFTDTFKADENNVLAVENRIEIIESTDALIEWSLKAPEYEGAACTLAANNYKIGPSRDLIALRSAGNMQIISNTTREEFEAYEQKLKDNGYELTAENEIGKNRYVQYKKGANTVYTYYIASLGEVRVIDDSASTPESKFEYTYTPKAGDVAAIYQYGMMYDPKGGGSGNASDGIYCNAGAFLIIKLSDNSLILIDGGDPASQATVKATEALMEFLYEITGVDPAGEEKIKIAAIFISHAHNDHIGFSSRLVSSYHSKIDVQRVMYNMPASNVGAFDGMFTSFASNVTKNFPDSKYIKPHTGQSIQLGDATIEVLYTHEDAVDAATGMTQIVDYNNTSTILRITVGGKTMIALGDWGGNSQSTALQREEYVIVEKRIFDMYCDEAESADHLKADIVQVAHHAINSWMGNIYAAIEADYAFFSQADVEQKDFQHSCYGTVINQLENAGMSKENMYFAGRSTNGLVIAEDGTITHTAKKIEGVNDDYWGYVEKFNPFHYTSQNG